MQDLLVGGAALAAGLLVVWRLLAAWRPRAREGRCEHCALADAFEAKPPTAAPHPPVSGR